ncbi:MAG TPA: glucoamylase family protein, partial [Chthoniobacterales bacterium]
QLVHRESQNQASDQVSVSHSIASLRLLGAIDWKDFVENLSLVEKTLRAEPAGIYAAMDFGTRDRYRHAVETFSRNCAFSEIEVAEKAVALAEANANERGREDRTSHVGYFLIDKGRSELVQATKVRWPKRQPVERAIRRFPFIYYAGGIFVLTLLATWESVNAAATQEVVGWPLFFCAIAFALGVSQLAVSLLNWLTTLLVSPNLLPRLDYSHGIAPESSGMVVVPTLLTSRQNIDELLETIEIHHLANRDLHLHFALLTDWDDAPAESMPNDAALLERARTGIESLNRKYAGFFFLFHRPRRWNASENVWMGYERKRGKLMQLNAFLRGGCQDCFLEVVGNRAVLPSIKYIITLDSDTQLPRESARQLIGTMAHPLNRPQFDARGVVTEGYGLLQPRVDVNLPSAGRSWFVRLHAGEVGIDPYTRAVSDVYQDLFREGSFIGKGIYDVDAFESALADRFPDNRILSHDLLESVYARCGLVSDVQFYEEFPTRYEVDVVRRQRWIRGDWQIARWLLPWAPGAHGRRRNPISGLSWWKIFDNLRRSLVPIALLFLLLGSWLLLPAIGDLASGVVLAIVALPGLFSVVVDALRKPETLPWTLHWRATLSSALRNGGQIGLTLAFLPNDAFLSLGAIGRTLWRLLITRKHLLEWRTSSDVARTARTSLSGSYLTMWIAPLVALGSAAVIDWREPELLVVALPYFVLWLGAPAIAWWISQPLGLEKPELSDEQVAFLRQTARRTWHFFETFVNAEENWLPPDNFQKEPFPTIASRTSPTNIGLALLANLAARDFGYLSLGRLLRRTEATIETLLRLSRHRGHFFNWYDTHTLQPLLPLYVSTVDSGNLAGHLLTLGSGLRGLADKKIYDPQIFAGLRDTLRLLGNNENAIAQLDSALAHPPASLPEAIAALERITQLPTSLTSESEETKAWAQTLVREAQEHLNDLRSFAGVRENVSLRELAGDPGEAGAAARDSQRKLETLAAQADELAEMDFSFLFGPARELFAIGFNVSENRRDLSFYDLLASEARLGSYVAIAQGQVRQDHWFSLGRLLVAPRGEPVLVSWSGSMFEYLMPLLVMPDYPDTLLQRTCAAAVRLQIEYGKSRNVPWGISESGYYLTDAQHNYQYRAFGVPGLGLKRGLAEDLVIAPYATVMALMIAPREACENLQRLARENRAGVYGFYEAIDYTPSRLPPGETSATVRSYMAHHQGMSLLALLSLLRDEPMQRRFMSRPMLKAAELLLQERLPKTEASVLPEDLEVEDTRPRLRETEGVMRIFQSTNTRTPEVQLLSNGNYHVAVTNAGGGYSRWRDLAVTRWREDATRDDWGSFIYVRDVQSGEFWSAAYQPALRATKSYEAIFTQARAEFRERRGSLELHTELSVSPEDDVELRRVTLTNHGAMARMIELTSYAEVVLADAAADAAHPAFSNLFVQTEFQPARSAILCTRRARTAEEKPPWLLHLLVGQGGIQGEISGETDRVRFVGRDGTLVSPAALQKVGLLSNTDGSVLDPIVALRRTVVLQPNEIAVLDFVTGMAEERAAADALVEKYQQSRIATRAFDLAWTHSQVTLRQLNASEADAQLYARLAGAIIFADPARRATPGVLLDNRRGQSALWTYGISGDAPVVLLRIADREKIEIVRQLVQAHSYWRTKGLKVELVILNEDVSVYRQSLQDQITDLIASGSEAQMLDQPGGIFVRRLEQIPNDDRVLLQSIARIVLDDENGTLLEQMERRTLLEPPVPAFSATEPAWVDSSLPLETRELAFANGL